MLLEADGRRCSGSEDGACGRGQWGGGDFYDGRLSGCCLAAVLCCLVAVWSPSGRLAVWCCRVPVGTTHRQRSQRPATASAQHCIRAQGDRTGADRTRHRHRHGHGVGELMTMTTFPGRRRWAPQRGLARPPIATGQACMQGAIRLSCRSVPKIHFFRGVRARRAASAAAAEQPEAAMVRISSSGATGGAGFSRFPSTLAPPAPCAIIVPAKALARAALTALTAPAARLHRLDRIASPVDAGLLPQPIAPHLLHPREKSPLASLKEPHALPPLS
ncbi:hypothetical protein BS50DRAFT_243972 [Corynespora cassiicola Philippines]|uniref:Uncharacterized protein n=1 Tax=Corynespora cassiicola Philippines TaxID=1448308 RepID=A0A2T2P4A2_CORCC|nr:hypothetical protein BS50DRAFT_243972 [Corynespora cassiicola Philippines]